MPKLATLLRVLAISILCGLTPPRFRCDLHEMHKSQERRSQGAGKRPPSIAEMNAAAREGIARAGMAGLEKSTPGIMSLLGSAADGKSRHPKEKAEARDEIGRNAAQE